MTADVIELKKRIENADSTDVAMTIFESVQDPYNYSQVMGPAVCNLLLNAKSATEFQTITDTLCAVTGWDIEELLERAEQIK